MIYLAVNGDNVGLKIGQHIASDDHKGLQASTSALKAAQDTISKWVEAQGGKEIASSGDEGVYMIPESAIGELDGIKDQYKQVSGHGLTVGVGSSMSEAAKALIFGKLNGKDQVVHYDESVESALTEDPEAQEEVDEITDEDGDPAEIEGEGEADTEEDMLEDDYADEDENTEEVEDPTQDEYVPEDVDEDVIEDKLDSDQNLSVEQELQGQADEKSAQELGIDGESNGDEDSNSENMVEDVISEESDEENGDSEGFDGGEDGEDEVDSDSVYGDLNGEEGQEGENELGDSDEQEGAPEESGDDYLSDMIHSQMDGEEEVNDDQNNEESNDEELKNDIAEALMAFKQHKNLLEAAQEQNPELYQAVITMLRSMIDMGKRLGYAPEQDMESVETENETNEEFPYAREEEGEGEGEVEEESEDQQIPDMEENPIPGKK
jgi:hypothetical protein